MRLSDLIKIDNRFEKAINLGLDLNSQEKIDHYIPTRSAMNILGDYIDSVRVFSGNRARVLIGPYGKGKSHLLLILLAILSQEQNVNLSDLFHRMEIVNPEVAKAARTVMDTTGPMLPVIINSNGNTLSQDFMRAIVKALNAAGLKDIVPDSYYSEATKMIRTWKSQFPDTYRAFEAQLGNIGAEKFIRALKKYDERALSQFRKIYPALTSGAAFNPIVDDEIVAVYQSVNRALRVKHGYGGIFIIFDEFSKYIEGHPIDRFSEDMKVLQDMCELCNASRDEQLHLTCVAHKSIKSYGTTLAPEILNSFRGVEGRLKEISFVVTAQNSYELLSDVIGKTPAFYQWAEKSEKYQSVIQESWSLKSFQSLFSIDDYRKIVGEGCFPLTPVAASLLLILSEKIAQNERTVFTYIASRDDGSLLRTLKKAKTPDFIGVDGIYDYFAPLLKEESENRVHHEWLKAEYALSKTSKRAEQTVIKTISVIRMINRSDELIASDKFLRAASGMPDDVYFPAIKGLVEKKLVELRSRTSAYEFKNNIGIDVEEAIADCIKKRFRKVDEAGVLQEIFTEKAILPKKHNQEYCMTRYFNTAFLSQAQFLAMKSTSYLSWLNDPDGVVVFILPEAGLEDDTVFKHTAELGDCCLLVCMPNSERDCKEMAKRFLAVSYLAGDTTFIDENLVIKKELENILEDLVVELNRWVVSTYFPLERVIAADGPQTPDAFGLNRLVSNVCDRAYSLTPVINQELINRHHITAQIVRARSNIMVKMLDANDVEAFQTGSSAESTIYRAIFRQSEPGSGLYQAKDEIRTFIQKAEQDKQPLSELIGKLISPPYGMRKGPLPLLLLDAILKQPGMPVIYLGSKEVPLNVDTVVNMVTNAKDYYLQMEAETVQAERYLSDMSELFSDFSEYCREADRHSKMAHLVCVMQSWYRSLPQTSMIFSNPDNEKQNMSQIVAFRKIFANLYLNPRQILFETLPTIFSTNTLDETFGAVADARKEIDAHIHIVKRKVVQTIRTAFALESEADLGQSLKAWYHRLPEATRNSVTSAASETITAAILGVNTSDEERIAGDIVYAVTGIFIEDWKTETNDLLRTGLNTYIQELRNQENVVTERAQKLVFLSECGKPVECFYDYDPEHISSTGTFFKNDLINTLEEYDTLEKSEKIGILMEMIRKLTT